MKVTKANRRMRRILVYMISVLIRYSTIRNVFAFSFRWFGFCLWRGSWIVCGGEGTVERSLL